MLGESRTFVRHNSGGSHWLSLLLTPEVFVLILQYFCFSFVWYFYITWCPRTCERLEPNRPRELPLSPRSLCFSVVLVPLLPDWWQPGFRAGSSRSSVSSDR